MVTAEAQAPTSIKRNRQPAPADAVTFQLLETKGKEYRATPLHRHYEPDLDAAFYLKPLTGADMDNAIRLAGEKAEDITMYMVFISCAYPKIANLEWVALNGVSPGIKGRLLAAIREISGLGEDALDKAKLLLRATVGESSDGTDSLENSDTDQ